jgi:hypothetical protein
MGPQNERFSKMRRNKRIHLIQKESFDYTVFREMAPPPASGDCHYTHIFGIEIETL